MIPLSLALPAAAVALVAAFSAGWATRGWKEDSARLETERVAQQDYRASVRKMESVADAYLRGKAEGDAREVEVEKEVIRVVSKTVYRDRCLDDDGLRIVQSDISYANAQRGLAPEVPASAASR